MTEDVAQQVVDQLTAGLRDPLAMFANPSKRVFWPFLLGGLVIAGLVLVARRRARKDGDPREPLWRGLFPAGVWTHPSTRLDAQLIIAKSLVRALLFAPWMLSAYALALGLVSLLDNTLGHVHVTGWSAGQITALYTVVLFLAWDLSRYWLHRWAHTIPLLWEFHKVHHSAQVMTPLTLYRSHPIENLLFMLRGVLTTGLVTGVFFFLFRGEAVQTQFLGVNALGFVFNLLGANLRHSHLWLSYGPRLERLFISPAQHQIHHSDQPQHHDRNYGSCLAIWDWIGGSLYVTRAPEALAFGLPEAELNHDPHDLKSALVGPLAACVERLKPGRPSGPPITAGVDGQ